MKTLFRRQPRSLQTTCSMSRSSAIWTGARKLQAIPDGCDALPPRHRSTIGSGPIHDVTDFS